MRCFYDCEFIEDGRTIDLVSIGIVADSEPVREYYAVSSDFDVTAMTRNPWLMEHVWPHLPTRGYSMGPGIRGIRVGPDVNHPDVKSRCVIADEVRAFLARDAHVQPQLWARWGAYDHVVLMWLWGDMSHHPDELPFYSRDLQQRIDDMQEMLGREIELPEQAEGEHNALADARHNRVVARHLDEITRIGPASTRTTKPPSEAHGRDDP